MLELRRGITRTVILTRRHAIKVPSLRSHGDGLTGLLWSVCRGVLANQAEAQWWRHAVPDQRPFLCPVLRTWIGGVINVYPRCAPMRVPRGVALAMLRREFRPLPMLMPQPGDNKPDNYGWLGERLVVLDYDLNYNGCPHDRSGALNTLEDNG